MRKNLFLQGRIDKNDDCVVEIRTEGSEPSFKSYCCVISTESQYTPLELEAYSDEYEARAGHLNWLNQRERCLAYLESLGLMRRPRYFDN